MSCRLATLLLLVGAHGASAQNKLVGITGIVFRYQGDTIWVDRDSTSTRVVFSGDTVTKRVTMNGALRVGQTLLLVGDSARILSLQDSTGRMVASPVSRAMPALFATMERRQLETELRTSTIMQRTASVTGNIFQPSPSPDPARKYTVSPMLSITQHRDTVWYVKGCPALGRVDTTVFLIFGSDSTRRLSNPQRTFGEAMATGLIGQMRGVLTQERLATMAPPPPNNLPAIRNQCLSAK
jgi:hypothetical protein